MFPKTFILQIYARYPYICMLWFPSGIQTYNF
jgi:hypothetical protein